MSFQTNLCVASACWIMLSGSTSHDFGRIILNLSSPCILCFGFLRPYLTKFSCSMMKLWTPNRYDSSGFQISAGSTWPCYLGPEGSTLWTVLPAHWLWLWFLPGRSKVPLQKGNLRQATGLACTCAPAPPGHTDTARAIWLFEFKHRFQRQ